MKAHDRSRETSTERLVTDLKRVVHDSQDLLHSSADAVGDGARVMRERLSEALDAAQDTCRKLEQKIGLRAEAADSIIRENPYQSIGVAFGIGLLIGVLVTRR